MILHITHVPLLLSTTSIQSHGNSKAALRILTLPYQTCQKKPPITQIYTYIRLEFTGREKNSTLLKWNLTFRLGDEPIIMSQGLLIYHLLPELFYLAVCVVLSPWKRSLNGLSYCNLRCCLSARGYSPPAGSVEESVPSTGCSATAIHMLVWTSGEITDGSS